MVPILLEDKLKYMIKTSNVDGFIKIFIETPNGKSVAYADRVLKRLDRRKKIPFGWKSKVKDAVRTRYSLKQRIDKEVATPKSDRWYEGFACALAYLAKENGAEAAQEICFKNGVDRDELVRGEAEQADIDAIFGEENVTNES